MIRVGATFSSHDRREPRIGAELMLKVNFSAKMYIYIFFVRERETWFIRNSSAR